MESKDIKQIEILLEAYLAGNSTREQEQQLRRYFLSSSDVPAELEYARAMFGYFQKQQQVQFAPKRTARITRRRLWSIAGSVAAVIAVGVTLAIMLVPEKHHVVYCYINGVAVTDYNQALSQTCAVLDFVGESVAEPTQYLSTLGQFSESMEQLEELTRLLNADQLNEDN